MSQISLKSISGITSITTSTGVDNQLTLHTNNTTQAFKLDHAGNLHFNNHVNASGIVTATTFKGDGDFVELDVDGHTNLDNVSVSGISTFSGILDATNTPASIRVAQDIQHKGDADTKISFDTNRINLDTGGINRVSIADTGFVINDELYINGNQGIPLRIEGSLGTTENIHIRNYTSGGHIQFGFRQNDSDGHHHRAYITVSKGTGSVSGKLELKVRGQGGGTNRGFILDAGVGIQANQQILPETDSIYDLGSNTLRWQNLFVDDVTVTGVVTATSFTGSGANLTALPAPNRNLIENGEFLVSQRFGNASSTKANSGTNIVNGVENGVVDRWRMSSPSASNFARQRVTDVPDGFAYSFKVTNDSSVYSPASNANYSSFQQIIEATNVARLAFGTSSAKTVTLSFYVKSTYASSTWAVALGNCTGGHYSSGNNTRTHIKSYSISSANTWERKTITFPGDTSGTWTKEGTDGGLAVIWDLGSGGSHQGTAQNTWANGDDYRFSGAKNVGDAANGSWQITGIQLEIGATATEYEHIPIQKEIERCQRYFYCSGLLGSGSWNSAQLFHCAVHHPVAMRARITSASTRSGLLSNINIEPRDEYDVTAFQPAGHTHYSPGQVHSNQVMNFQISGSASTADAGTIAMDRNDDQFWLSAEL